MRFINHTKAMIYGDYLFSFSENIPYRILQLNVAAGNIKSSVDSLLVSQICADRTTDNYFDEISSSEDTDGEDLPYEDFVPAWPSWREIYENIPRAIRLHEWDCISFLLQIPLFPQVFYAMCTIERFCRERATPSDRFYHVTHVSFTFLYVVVTYLACI